MESTKEVRVWHKGPPPHVGWWNATTQLRKDVWRWWDGKQWSTRAYQQYSPQAAAICALRPEQSFIVERLQWSDYWPENARVPRIAP